MEYYTPEQIAKITGRSVNTIKYWRTFCPEMKPFYEVIKDGQYKKLVIPTKNLYKFVEFSKSYGKYKPKGINYWTITAKECYERHLVCKGCINEEFCNRYKNGDLQPPIKKKIIEIYRKNGKPR